MNNKINVLKANQIQDASYVSGTKLNAMMYSSGGRMWFATAIPYNVIGTLVQTTQVKSKNAAISSEVVNRFLDSKHVNELKHYIVENINNFTIPPITLVSKTRLSFDPITFGLEHFESMDEVYDVVKTMGSILGKITIPLGYTFTCLDGNHRAKAIADLAIDKPDLIQGNQMLCNIVYEVDNLRIRQDFVDINQNAKTTTATINTLFNSRDPLAKLTAQTIDEIDYLNENTELLSSSISKKSKKLYTLNNIKNTIVELANYNSQSRTSINSMSNKLTKDPEFSAALMLEKDVFFDILKNNDIINDFLLSEKLEDKVSIKSKGVITTGVGLIIASRVVSVASENLKNLSYTTIVNKVINFDWSRDNEFFKGKILSEEGNIISSTNSISSTANALLKELFPEIPDQSI